MKFVIALIVLVITFVIVVAAYSKTLPLSVKDQNKDVVLLSVFAFNECDWSSFADLHSPAYVQHAPDSVVPVSWGEYILSCSVAHDRFPGLQYRVDDIFAVDDKVAVITSWQYRNDSDQFKQQFPDGIILGSKIGLFKLRDGKIIEEWSGCDPVLMQRFIRIGYAFSAI